MARIEPRGLNVLVVEDNEDAATIEALVLGMEHHAVTIASDGSAALHEIRQGTPDVVLLDLGLPGLDGYEVAECIHHMGLPKRPLLVAVTARDDAEDVRRSREVGIDIHLVKPVPPEKLCVLLRAVSMMVR